MGSEPARSIPSPPARPVWSALRRRLMPGSTARAAAARRPILCLGDSITEQWGLHRPGFFAAHDLVCRGYGGETSGHARIRLEPTLAETRAAGLHLLCGINDIAHNAASTDDAGIRASFAAILAGARTAGVDVLVGSLTPCAWLVHGGIDPRPRIAALNAWLRAHAGEVGAAYLDYHAVLATPEGGLRPGYGTDGLHLSPAGYAAIEPVLLAAIGRPA